MRRGAPSNILVIMDLSGVRILHGLSDEQRARIASIGTVQRFKRGQMIFAEDSEGHELYFLISGRLEILIRLKNDEQRIAVHQAGESFGEFAAMDRSRRSASAQAVTDIEVLSLKGEDFYRMLEQDTDIGYLVMRNLCNVLCDRLKNANLQWRNAIYWG